MIKRKRSTLCSASVLSCILESKSYCDGVTVIVGVGVMVGVGPVGVGLGVNVKATIAVGVGCVICGVGVGVFSTRGSTGVGWSPLGGSQTVGVGVARSTRVMSSTYPMAGWQAGSR